MSLFNITDFERQNNPEADVYLNDGEETRDKIIKLSKNALKSIKIYTPDLEQALYNNESFRENLIHFIRKRPANTIFYTTS